MFMLRSEPPHLIPVPAALPRKTRESHHLEGRSVMVNQSVRLAIEMTAQCAAFTINFALTSNLPYALDLLAASQGAKQADQTAVETCSGMRAAAPRSPD